MKTKFWVLGGSLCAIIIVTWLVVSNLLSNPTPQTMHAEPDKHPETTFAGLTSSPVAKADIGYLHLDGNVMAVALDQDAEQALLAILNRRDEPAKEAMVTSGQAINVADGTAVRRLGDAGRSLVHVQILGGIHGNEEVYAPAAWFKKKSL